MVIKLVELNPMRVASFQYVGENPELNAFKELTKWVQGKNLLSKNVRYHFFGFNNPIPTENNSVYGYEVWFPLDDDFEGDDEIKIKEFKGGLFAVKEMLLSDFISDQGWTVFHSEAELWMKENMYEYDHTVQWLEEHIVEKQDINNFIQKKDLSNWTIGLYLPVRKVE
ncbi:MAG: effector binding domain-containing protein [Promethearchaeota archaeon]